MKIGLKKELNRETLLESTKILEKINYCIFYGSMLGVHRDGDVIDGDDDVDLLIENKDFELVDAILKKSGFRQSQEINGQRVFPGIFSQYYKIRDNTPTLLDIYFYHDVHEKYVIDKWNNYGQPHNSDTHLIIPKSILFETKREVFFGQDIKIPNNAEIMCKYIYGSRYKEPLLKNIDYKQEMQNNRFLIKYKNKKG